MPFYEFTCLDCKKDSEILVRSMDDIGTGIVSKNTMSNLWFRALGEESLRFLRQLELLVRVVLRPSYHHVQVSLPHVVVAL